MKFRVFVVFILFVIGCVTAGCSASLAEESKTFAEKNKYIQLQNEEGENESNEKEEMVKDDELGVGKYTGYFLKTESQYFFISAQENETFYKDEPVKISPPSWIEDTTVDFNGLSNGDKIEVAIFQIEDSEPRAMPVYGMELIEDGTLDNISNDVIRYLAELGYRVIND